LFIRGGIIVDQDDGLASESHRDGVITPGNPFLVTVLKGGNGISVPVEGGIDSGPGVEADVVAIRHDLLGVLCQTGQVRQITCVARSFVHEDPIDVDVACGVCAPSFIYRYIRLHFRSIACAPVGIHISQQDDIIVAVQPCNVRDVVCIGIGFIAGSVVRVYDEAKGGCRVCSDAVYERLPYVAGGVYVER